MSEPLLSIEQLRVDYEDVTAVDDVSFSIEAGTIYGLIGPNGAGKTSIIKVIATLLEPTYGQVRVGGIDLLDDPRRALRQIGYMPDFPPIYEDLTVFEFLELFASAYDVPIPERRSRIEALIKQVQLDEKRDQLAGGLSRGMKQRLFLARTLLHNPDVLLLDEPASGLDPRARLDFRDIIIGLGKAGKAVLVSSHILAEMADFCTAVGIMEQGRMVVTGRIEDILHQLQPGLTLTVRLLSPDDRLGGFLEAYGGISDIVINGNESVFKLAGEANTAAGLLRALVQENFGVADFHEKAGNLQDIFLQVSTGRVS